MRVRTFFSLLVTAFLLLGICEGQAWGQIVKVNCNRGETITRALQALEAGPITIEVKGICTENIDIVLDDVTLIAANQSATVNGPDAKKHTITIRGHRAVIDGLTVTGGYNGINVSGVGGAQIRNCTVQNTFHNGIVFYQDGRGAVDKCTVQHNGHHGISIEAASAKVINSTISLNPGVGIVVSRGGNAKIGMNDVPGEPTAAGNTISNNGGHGINIWAGGSAYIIKNTIQGNGTNYNAEYGRDGIHITMSTAVLAGENTITMNQGCGVIAFSSSVYIGNSGYGVSTRNTITQNGQSSQTIAKNGVYGVNGASFSIYDADISNNKGNGVTLNLHSSANINGSIVNSNMGDGVTLWMNSGANIVVSTINYNKGNGVTLALRSSANINGSSVNYTEHHGIVLTLGGGLVLGNDVTVTGNFGWGLLCNDGESSWIGDPSVISGNGGGEGDPNISGGCTPF